MITYMIEGIKVQLSLRAFSEGPKLMRRIGEGFLEEVTPKLSLDAYIKVSHQQVWGACAVRGNGTTKGVRQERTWCFLKN